LFFLHMPKLFRHLSRFSFLPQQMLLPMPPSSFADQWTKIEVSPFATSLVKHYNTYRTKTCYATPADHVPGEDGRVSFWSRGKITEREVNLTHIDSFGRPEDGVWHPDGFLTEMGWMGSGAGVESSLGISGFFNPFGPVDAKVVELEFTEKLPSPQLQWAMHTCKDIQSTPRDRGNLAIAHQDIRPNWLSKPSWLAFGSLRAFPMGENIGLKRYIR